MDKGKRKMLSDDAENYDIGLYPFSLILYPAAKKSA
jgi:hypothetical protein